MATYRRLAHNEIIRAGDEIDRCGDPWRDEPKWEPIHPSDIGQPAPDPQYVSHRQYRRREADPIDQLTDATKGGA